MTTDDTAPRDLDAEQEALEGDGWYFQPYIPQQPKSRDPRYVRDYMVKAWRGDPDPVRATTHAHGYGDSLDEARAKCIDKIKSTGEAELIVL